MKPVTLRRLPLAALAAAGTLALAACNPQPLGGDGPEGGYYSSEEGGEEGGEGLSVPLVDAEGAEVGTVEISEEEGQLLVHAEVEGLTTGGFHGFHVHERGVCEPDSAAPDDASETGDFLSAGGHLASGDQEHGEHAGDMPSLRALEDGTAVMEVHLDGLTLADLEDEDGSAVMVHADPDNFANIPERYAPDGPDEETLSTGDAGDRIACGVVEAG